MHPFGNYDMLMYLFSDFPDIVVRDILIFNGNLGQSQYWISGIQLTVSLVMHYACCKFNYHINVI